MAARRSYPVFLSPGVGASTFGHSNRFEDRDPDRNRFRTTDWQNAMPWNNPSVSLDVRRLGLIKDHETSGVLVAGWKEKERQLEVPKDLFRSDAIQKGSYWTEWSERAKNTRCSFRCNCLILGEVARPERFELPAFWFVARSAKTSKCRYWYRLRATRATLFCP